MRNRLECDVLDNVDVNFLFNKGDKLTNGLIDPERLFSVMNKIKNMVNESKIISYKEICEYVEEQGTNM